MARALFLLFCYSLLWGQQVARFSIQLRLIRVEVAVTHRDRPVLNLKRKDFLAFDEGAQQFIQSLDIDEQPLDIMLLLDVSGSMSDMLESLKLRAVEALKELRPRDRVGVMSFSGEHYLVLPPTFAHDVVASEIQYLYVRGLGTELYRNILETGRYLHGVARPGVRKAILIITDNDGTWRVSSATALHGLWEYDIVLHGIFYLRGHLTYLADCRPIIEGTGGDLLWAHKKNFPLAEMFRRMRQRYVLTYQAPLAEANEKRRIQVRLRPQDSDPAHKQYRVSARHGYVVP